MNINTILSPIQNELQAVESLLGQSVAIDFEPLHRVFESLIQSGGKRIRPALTVLANKFHSEGQDKALTLAVAAELIHAATLIHDDLIDKSPLRRGSPTINSRWSGTATVLAGDFLLARAADISASIEDFRVMRIFARTLMTICDGEIRQDLSGAHWPPNREEYYRHIDSKTASLFSACTEGGAVLSGGPEEEIQALKSFGHNLGMAFQIADDILDFTADEQQLGKPVGSDLRQGTLTLPVFYFLSQDPRGALLEKALRTEADHDGEMDEVIDWIRQSPAIGASKAEARRFVQAAQDALAILPDNLYRRTLSDLATYVVERSL